MFDLHQLDECKGKDNHFPMAKRLEGQVAIIAGGARGIGEATAKLFVKHGAMVVIADIEDDLGTALANSLTPLATFVHCDVKKEEDIRELIDRTVSTFGRLDILFNNAGVLGNQTKNMMSIMEFNASEFDHIIAINLRGTALGMKHAARVMAPRRRGCIISTASVAGVMGGLGPNAYTASKHAIIGLTKNAACELGKYGIRVNCISPFGVATSMLVNGWRDHENGDKEDKYYMDFGAPPPSKKEVEEMEELVRGLANLKGATLKPNDIAEAALYLASNESMYVSGHNLVVDGGFTAAKNSLGFY